MSPTNWQGITALCAIVGVLATILGGTWYLGSSGGKVTSALEGLRDDFHDFRLDFKESNKKTTQEIDLLKERTARLETYLDADGRIANVLELRRRRADS